MNTQEAFDTVARHLLTQGARAMRPNPYRNSVDKAACAYRADDGKRCAVGCLIPDELYAPRIEGQGYYQLVTDEPGFATYFKDVDTEMLNDLQGMHDTVDPSAWSFELLVIAESYDLDASVLDEFKAVANG